ncbi:MAG: aminotransferase class IV [Planctomycetes bacterium]|nr:aminotransferase class IV [Planctomycetota bacterium]
MSKTLFSINGKIVPEAEAVVPVTDRGFLYGDGLFETLHAYGRHLFRVHAHLQRMKRGFGTLAFEHAPTPATLLRWLQAAVNRADFPEANVRLTVTRGSGARGPSIRGAARPFAAITVTKYLRRPKRDYTQGVTAILASFRRQESSVIATLKTTAYIEQIFARREADVAGADEAILLNNSGLVCEGSSSNITLVKDGRIVAPDPKLVGALPGTAQILALELAEKLGLEVCRAGLGPWDLKECDEAFLSGSMRELTPLVKIGDTVIGNGKPGPITKKLLAAYRKQVEIECPGFRFD